MRGVLHYPSCFATMHKYSHGRSYLILDVEVGNNRGVAPKKVGKADHDGCHYDRLSLLRTVIKDLAYPSLMSLAFLSPSSVTLLPS